MKSKVVYVGVDVAKAYLDVAWEGESWRVANDCPGRKALVDSALDGGEGITAEVRGGSAAVGIGAHRRSNPIVVHIDPGRLTLCLERPGRLEERYGEK